MVANSRLEGGPQVLSAGVRRTIQSIKEIVGNHSDADIYVALKETNMDPNETAQKLLNQDPFHEVKRKRDRKKEPQNVAHKGFIAPEPRRNTEPARIPEKSSSYTDPNSQRGGYGLNTTSGNIQVKNSTFPDPNARRGGYGLNTTSGNIPVKNSTFPDPNARRGGYGLNTTSGNIPVKNSTFPDPNARRGGYGPNTTSGNIPVKNSTFPYPNARRGGYGPNTTSANIPVKNRTYNDRNPRRGGYGRNTASGASQEFRVVRDNRVGQNAIVDSNPDQGSILKSKVVISSGSIVSNPTETSGPQQSTIAQHSSLSFNIPTDSQQKETKDTTSGGNEKKETLGEKPLPVLNAVSHVQAEPNAPTPPSSSNSSVVGVYSSNSDPVHVPYLHPKPSANIGAIRRDVGVVGPRRQSSESSSKPSSYQSTPLPNTQSGQDGQPRESARPFSGMSKSDNSSQNIAPESSTRGLPVSKSFSSNQHVSRPHQPTGHQKAPQPNKEWKPKASVKPKASSPGVIGSPAKTVSPPSDKPDILINEATHKQDSMSQLNFSENKNVIIAAHIRVSETDRCRLTFGSLGPELNSSEISTSITAEGAEVPSTDPSGSVSVSVSTPESPGDGGKHMEKMMNDPIQSSGSDSPSADVSVSDHQLTEKKEYSVDVGLVRDHSPSFTPNSLQQQDTPELQSFSGYEPQTGYDMSYFRPIADETVRAQGLPSSQEVLTNTTIAMVHQQQHLAQMYPQQVHVSHFTNLMPYHRQFISPVYVPPMPVPGYSNGNSYMMMPGNKYNIQQFKPMPTHSGFGNFINTTTSVGPDEASRMKYNKDSNLYFPNPQAEGSEVWMNQRDGMQSGSYYSMGGQTGYLASHSGQTAFTASHSSHVQQQQFAGIYHPAPQHGGVAPAAGGQVGGYQQAQLGHLNWAGNF